MTQFTPCMIDTASAGSCGTLEKIKEAFGFVPAPQPHIAESSELLEWQALIAEAA
ncbi:hypothetical protein KHC23_23060 [Ancylobacter dichloromethanicus]|uniref:Uncharacterized protein n=1 Tax=Ancylobacter dichloromethanicus TaxID=518825 RepID=A0A9W6N0W7_9HYPH|nr:hypothetical protein [Ancylobacter dichloromethanicus]MBS7556515.1 hypothetical protein [Ancylobacter dichloromethanicus]GLK73603.1 hypothetical protein GCM10017643_37210 [Ancylobacter dichloromethanicus]